MNKITQTLISEQVALMQNSDLRKENEAMRAVVDAAGAFAVTDSPELPDDSRCAVIVSVGQIRALAAALAALPQPATKGKQE